MKFRLKNRAKKFLASNANEKHIQFKNAIKGTSSPLFFLSAPKSKQTFKKNQN